MLVLGLRCSFARFLRNTSHHHLFALSHSFSTSQRGYGSTTTFPGHSRAILIRPQVYSPLQAAWQDLDLSLRTRRLSAQQHLKIVSWNIDFASPNPERRADTLMKYLYDQFSQNSEHLVILLQEVCLVSLHQILVTPWIRDCFLVTGVHPPVILQDGLYKPARYFNIILTPRGSAVARAFRIPWPSEMGRDGVFVDLAVEMHDRGSAQRATNVLRLCSTHLESLHEGGGLRRRQLEILAMVQLADKNGSGDGIGNVVASLAGGDFNAIGDEELRWPCELGLADLGMQTDTVSHRDREQVLSGSLEDVDEEYTWGLQPRHAYWPPRRFDKFLSSGNLLPISLDNSIHVARNVRRIGIGLQVGNDADGDDRKQTTGSLCWVSDHFGIVTDIKILGQVDSPQNKSTSRSCDSFVSAERLAS